MKVNTTDASQTLTLSGSLEPLEMASIYGMVTGYLTRVHVDIGDRVKQGQHLAQLTIPEMQPQLQLAEAKVVAAMARLLKAEADVGLAFLNHRRLSELKETEPRAITDQDLDVVAAQVKIAGAEKQISQAEVQVAEAEVARLKTLMSYATVRAPFDGLVTGRFAHPGTLVVAGATNSRPIVEIARIDKLRLSLNIPEPVVPWVKSGVSLRYTLDAFPGKSFDGVISRVSGVLSPETRSMRAEIDLDNSNGELHAGMYANVYFEFNTISAALTLPATTLRHQGEETVVFRVVDGVAHRVAVKILMDDGNRVVVTGDLNPGEQVVMVGPSFLEDGQKVRVEGS